MNISKEKAIQIAINEAIKGGAGVNDIATMEKKAEEKDTCFLVSIYPKPDGNQNYDVSVRINKQTGKVESIVFGQIEKPR